MDFPPELVDILQNAQNVVILTGAGISAESGIPTFRDRMTGLWERYRPEELATPLAFQRNPQLVWDWYEWRRGLVKQAQPNPGHYALAQMEKKLPEFTLITQNVDGYHIKAGSRNVIEFHGNIFRNKCFENNHPYLSQTVALDIPPRCRLCDSVIRPDVVWFGESLPPDAMNQAVNAVQTCDIFFAIGTSGLVQPAASLAPIASRAGAKVVRVNLQSNPEEPEYDFDLIGRSGEILPELVRQVWSD